MARSPDIHSTVVERARAQIEVTARYLEGARIALKVRRGKPPPTDVESLAAYGTFELGRRHKEFLQPDDGEAIGTDRGESLSSSP